MRGDKYRLWCAVDQNAFVLDEMLQRRLDAKAARWLLRALLKKAGGSHRRMITDKLRSYGATERGIASGLDYRSHKELKNRFENSHLPYRFRDKVVRGHRSLGGYQRFVSMHSAPATLSFCSATAVRRRTADATVSKLSASGAKPPVSPPQKYGANSTQ